MTDNTRPFRSLADLKERNAAMGGHFFDADSMRFFSSRVSSKIHPTPHGAYFVTSERFDAEADRLYTVRYMQLDGRVNTVGTFQQHATAAVAHRKARLLAEADVRAQARIRLEAGRQERIAATGGDILTQISDVLGDDLPSAERVREDSRVAMEGAAGTDRYLRHHGDRREDDFAPDNGAAVDRSIYTEATSGEGAIYSREYLASKTGRSEA